MSSQQLSFSTVERVHGRISQVPLIWLCDWNCYKSIIYVNLTYTADHPNISCSTAVRVQGRIS